MKEQWMQKTVVVWFLAMICCLLWGSAFPCIKIGYKMFHIASADASSQLLFAGCRFFLAGVLVLLLGTSGNFKLKDRDSDGNDFSCFSDDITVCIFLYGTCPCNRSKVFDY